MRSNITIHDLQLNSHITFPKLELIMENLILDFKDQRSGTQLMIRLKQFLFLNLNKKLNIIFRCTDIANYLVLRNLHPTFPRLYMCISVCLCVYSLICCHIVPRTINLFKLSYWIWLLGIFNLLVISGSPYSF